MPNASSKAARWTSPATGMAVLFFAIVGLISSIALIHSELEVLQDPEANLLCDVNPLIGCSSSLLSPQAHLLVIPNAAVGLMAFGALAALGTVLTFKGSLPRLVWWGMSAGVLAGVGFVAFFLHASVAVFRALCPYCMLTWVAVLALVPTILGGALASGSFGDGPISSGKTTLKYSWAIALVLYLIVVLVIVVTMSDKIGYLF